MECTVNTRDKKKSLSATRCVSWSPQTHTPSCISLTSPQTQHLTPHQLTGVTWHHTASHFLLLLLRYAATWVLIFQCCRQHPKLGQVKKKTKKKPEYENDQHAHTTMICLHRYVVSRQQLRRTNTAAVHLSQKGNVDPLIETLPVLCWDPGLH